MKTLVPQNIQTYIDLVTDKPDIVQEKLSQFTSGLPQEQMRTPHVQCVFLSILVASMGAVNILEAGVFTGYSSLAMAAALPENGKLIACDINAAWTDIARRYWEESGVSNRIDLRIAPVLDTMNRLLQEGYAGTFDLIYMDADKKGYEKCYEAALLLLRKDGLIAFDNMLWRGQVAEETPNDKIAKTLRNFTLKISEDTRVSRCMLPLGDGLYLVRKIF